MKTSKKNKWMLIAMMMTFAVMAIVMICKVLPTMASGIKPPLEVSHPVESKPVEKPALPMIPESFTDLAKTCSPAVVNISTVKTISGKSGRVFQHFFGGPQDPQNPQNPFAPFFHDFFNNIPQREFKQNSLGSGFIVDKDGYILTNNHVVADADQIEVKLNDGKAYPAQVMGTDESTDLALIKIKSDHNLPALNLGDSDKLEIGNWVVAIGNPFGLEHTVTAGIVSAKGRVIGAGPYDDFIQTDASINPGNSGGPLIDLSGEVVGINTAIVAGGAGIGFAIPSNMAKEVISQLKNSGEVTRGWLGVGIQDLDQQLKEYYGIEQGVLVTEVFPGDPADKAGIKPNDIIVSINGKQVESSREISRLISGLAVGDTAEIKISRDGKLKSFDVAIAKRKESEMAASDKAQQDHSEHELGIQVSDITPDMAQRFRLQNAKGVMVVGVQADSQGDKAGFVNGDIIREINHQPVENVSDYRRLISDIKKGEPIQFYIKRAENGYVVIKLTK
jgi:serine protease Do